MAGHSLISFIWFQEAHCQRDRSVMDMNTELKNLLKDPLYGKDT